MKTNVLLTLLFSLLSIGAHADPTAVFKKPVEELERMFNAGNAPEVKRDLYGNYIGRCFYKEIEDINAFHSVLMLFRLPGNRNEWGPYFPKDISNGLYSNLYRPVKGYEHYYEDRIQFHMVPGNLELFDTKKIGKGLVTTNPQDARKMWEIRAYGQYLILDNSWERTRCYYYKKVSSDLDKAYID